jgi:hypothetical protein
MNFFQTMMGRTFYEARVPQLIKALESVEVQLKRIADHLEDGNNDSKRVDHPEEHAPVASDQRYWDAEGNPRDTSND